MPSISRDSHLEKFYDLNHFKSFLFHDEKVSSVRLFGGCLQLVSSAGVFDESLRRVSSTSLFAEDSSSSSRRTQSTLNIVENVCKMFANVRAASGKNARPSTARRLCKTQRYATGALTYPLNQSRKLWDSLTRFAHKISKQSLSRVACWVSCSNLLLELLVRVACKVPHHLLSRAVY